MALSISRATATIAMAILIARIVNRGVGTFMA
jgi:hypothetical protein